MPINSGSHDSTAFGAASDDVPQPSRQTISRLRGAPVDVDTGRVARVGVALLMAALATLVVTLFIAGARQNSQITSLQRNGVFVNVRVDACAGELGGSGSNASAYHCAGTFELGGRSYDVTIPGHSLRPTGSTVRVIAASSDPRLIATRSQMLSEHASAKVFLLPTVLLVVVLAVTGLLLVRRRRSTE
ncbi:MAG TPA: hypothetical protein VIJ99_01050 [Acidimicrobiales bacterium]